jgi:hypothetical protein
MERHDEIELPRLPNRRTRHRLLIALRSFVVVGLLFISISCVLGQSNPGFGRANDEFAKGNFKQAIEHYESLVQSKQWSAPLFYNLGNAYFRADDLGRAILNYERALALDPQQPETAANLALAREEARALELQHDRLDTALRHVKPDQVTILATVAFWLMVFSATVILLRRQRSVITLAVVLLGCLVTTVSIGVIYRIETMRNAVAIVTRPEVQARLATADNAGSVLQLPPGSEVRVLSERGDWVYAALPNNLRGWIPSSSVESVRL